MTPNIHQRSQILASLDGLNQAQAEKVLMYIKGLVTPSADDMAYQRFKREALKEIGLALGKKQKLNSSF